MKVRIELLGEETLGVAFPYDAMFVREIRRLGRRKWNAAKQRWEVHLSHLPEVISLFNLKAADVPAAALGEFERNWKGRTLKIALDPLHGRITGGILPGALAEVIDRQTSFELPGHAFSPKFKSGQWDGRKHLFDRKTQKFPAGLWPRIESLLRGAGMEFEVSPAQWPEHARRKVARCPTPLRPYQAEARARALEMERGILQIATGGGKTLLAAHLIQAVGARAVFFVHTRELLHQTAGVFERELGMSVGRLGDGLIELAEVTVATIQTAARALGLTTGAVRGKKKPEDAEETDTERATPIRERKAEITAAIESAGVVFFDECHHVPADMFYKMAFKTKAARWRYGLSATPWRDDGHDLMLEAALGPKICEVKCSDLIEGGYLVPPRIVMERAPAPAGRMGRMAYPDVYRTAIVENQARNRAIAAQAEDWAREGLSVLVLVAHIEHGKRLQELLPEAGFAFGNLDSATRRRFIEGLEQKLRPVLIATTLADEGLDIPRLDALILGGGGKSAVKAYQRLGRALRRTGEKREARVLDFMDFSPYLREHSLARLQLYRHEPRFEIETRGFQA